MTDQELIDKYYSLYPDKAARDVLFASCTPHQKRIIQFEIWTQIDFPDIEEVIAAGIGQGWLL